MQREHLLNLREIEREYWWHTNKRRLVLSQLARYARDRSALLEAGSGGGFFAGALAQAGWAVTASDSALEAARFSRENDVDRCLVFDAGLPWPVHDSSFDVVLMLDVLEHVREDVSCLREVHRVLRHDGIGIVTVPAHPSLFSSWDRMAGHERRYRKRQLAEIAESAGLRLLKLSYWNAISLPLAVVLRRLRSDTPAQAEFPPVPRTLNALLKCWGMLEDSFIRLMPLPMGLSLLAVFDRGETDEA